MDQEDGAFFAFLPRVKGSLSPQISDNEGTSHMNSDGHENMDGSFCLILFRILLQAVKNTELYGIEKGIRFT